MLRKFHHAAVSAWTQGWPLYAVQRLRFGVSYAALGLAVMLLKHVFDRCVPEETFSAMARKG